MSYLITFSAVEADSPSLLILYLVYKTGDEGFSVDNLLEILNDEVLFTTRLNDLIVGKMINKSDDKLILTKKGEIFASIFSLYRRILNLEESGG